MSPELRIEWEALGLLEFYCPKARAEADVVAKIHGNQTISEAVRDKALTLLGPYWSGAIGLKPE